MNYDTLANCENQCWRLTEKLSKRHFLLLASGPKEFNQNCWSAHFFTECYCGKQERDVVCGTAESFTKQFTCDQICDKYASLSTSVKLYQVGKIKFWIWHFESHTWQFCHFCFAMRVFCLWLVVSVIILSQRNEQFWGPYICFADYLNAPTTSANLSATLVCVSHVSCFHRLSLTARVGGVCSMN